MPVRRVCATARFTLRTGSAGSKGHPPCACFASGPLLESSDDEAAPRVVNRATARFTLRTGCAGSKGLLYTAIQNTRAKLVRRNQHRSSPNFVQLVLVLYQFCTNAQLFPPWLRATVEWKLNYEATHKITVFWAAPEPAGAYRGRFSIFELRLSACNLCIINR